MSERDLKTYHGVLMKGGVPDIDMYDLALEACVRAIEAESDAEDYHDIMINTADRVRVLESIIRELVAVAESYISTDGPITWDNFSSQLDKLKTGITKAKEVLGDA